jgi:hypothetical protein
MHKHEQGFTLSETLIAMALTLVVIGAAVNAFNSSMRLADTSRIVSEMNQNLQAGMSLVVRDMIQTGTSVPRGGVSIPGGLASFPVNRPGPVNGLGPWVFPNTWEVLPAVIPGGGLGPLLNGVRTDVISLMYADPTIQLNQFPLAAIAADGSNATVNAATNLGGPDGIRPGDIILFMNGLGNTIQMVTGVNAQVMTFAFGDPMSLNQPAAERGSITDLQSAPGVYPPTTAVRVLMISYYIDNMTDPALPRLVRRVNLGPELAIAMGLENIQITFDLVDGVLNPSNIETPVDPNSPHQIRKINLFLSARSLERNPNSRDWMRNSMATQVGLRSLSYTDRYR